MNFNNKIILIFSITTNIVKNEIENDSVLDVFEAIQNEDTLKHTTKDIIVERQVVTKATERQEVEQIVQNVPSVSHRDKRIRSQEDEFSVILAKRVKEREAFLSIIQTQNQFLTTSLNNSREEDAVDIFFKSIALTVKKLPPLAIKKAKTRILSLVSDIEHKYSDPQQSYQIHQTSSKYNFPPQLHQFHSEYKFSPHLQSSSSAISYISSS